jgi:hypothetical protein
MYVARCMQQPRQRHLAVLLRCAGGPLVLLGLHELNGNMQRRLRHKPDILTQTGAVLKSLLRDHTSSRTMGHTAFNARPSVSSSGYRATCVTAGTCCSEAPLLTVSYAAARVLINLHTKSRLLRVAAAAAAATDC